MEYAFAKDTFGPRLNVTPDFKKDAAAKGGGMVKGDSITKQKVFYGFEHEFG